MLVRILHRDVDDPDNSKYIGGFQYKGDFYKLFKLLKWIEENDVEIEINDLDMLSYIDDVELVLPSDNESVVCINVYVI